MAQRQSYQIPYARYPAVRIMLLMACGIVVASKLEFSTATWWMITAALMTLLFSIHFLTTKSLDLRIYYSGQVLYLVILLLSGALRYAMTNKQPPLLRTILETYTWDDMRFEGTVQEMRKSSTGTLQIDIEIAETILPDSLRSNNSYRIRALLESESIVKYPTIKRGNHMNFRATIYPLEEKRNPGAFDYKQYLERQGIYHQVGIDTIYTISPTPGRLSWSTLRQRTIESIDASYDAQTSPLAKALLIGYKQELSRDDKTAFARVGLSHIMAVSGLHVGFLLAPFWFLIPYFWTWKYGRQIGLLLLILLLVFYAGLTGFTASVTRASITGGFIMYAKLFNKVRDSINLTAVAAILILFHNPTALFEVGFQLSFGAVYIILLTMPVAGRVLPNRIRYRWSGKLIMIVLVSLLAQAGLFPVLSYYFGEFSLIGPVTNTLVVPFLGFIMPYALFMLPIGAVFPDTVAYVNLPVQYFLKGLHVLVTEISSWDASWIQIAKPEPILFLLWLAGIFFIASLPAPKLRWRLFFLLLLLLTTQQSSKIIRKLKPATLTVTFLDVGQGDAALIRTPGGKHLLIDAGRWTPDYNSGKYVIIPHLNAHGIEKLDAVFLSHPHADHIGGMAELIQSVAIDTIYHSGYTYTSALYKRYQAAAQEKGIPLVKLDAGTLLQPDPSIRILVFGPDHSRRGSDPNEHSMILELHYGSDEFLFLGDAGHEQEQRLLDNFHDLLDTDLLKVGHHGSKTSSSLPFLQITTPEISVVSLAKSNKFRHPHKEATSRLSSTGTRLYFTSLDGALIFTSNGSMINKVAWK